MKWEVSLEVGSRAHSINSYLKMQISTCFGEIWNGCYLFVRAKKTFQMNLNYVGIQYHLVIATNFSPHSLHTNNPNINTMSQSSSLDAEFAEKIAKAKAAAKAAI